MIECILNGKSIQLEASGSRRLIDVLREDIGLTGTKEGCGIGECGACTVLINGEAVNACLVLVGQVNGKEIITVEGLSKNGNLNLLQQNFIRFGAVQCGYCTPGFLMSATKLLEERDRPTQDEIKQAITGNLCRCTGYYKIISAIELASER